MVQLLKPAFLELVVHNKRSHGNEKPTHRNEEQPLLAATRESLRAATKTQHHPNKFKKNSSQPSTCPGVGLIPHLILTLTICIACMLSHVQLFATTRTPACQGPGPDFAQLSTLVRRETEKARDLRAWEHRAPLLTVSPMVKAPVLKRGRALGDGDSAGEQNVWELSEGVSSRPPKASGLLSED